MYRIIRHYVHRLDALRTALPESQWWNSGMVATTTIMKKSPQQSRNFSDIRPYKAAILEEFNKKLVIESITNRTKLADGMVRVGVRYCSLNLNDVKYMQHANEEILLPMIPGSEFSGEILELNENCRQGFKPGDKVASLLAHKHLGGGLAAECVVSEDECFDVGSVSLKNAAVLAQGHGTALLAFTRYCELKENDNVIVIAGPGGNGLAAIQLASSVFKAKVYAICDTEDTSALIRDEGAHKSISVNEGLTNVYKFLASSLKEKKAKVVYDAVGGGLMYVAADFIDANGFFFTADPFYSPESFSKPEFKKTTKKGAKGKDEIENSDDFVAKIKYVDLSDYRLKNLNLYRQIIQDALSLCEEEIISPYISRSFSLYDVNRAVKFIQEKKCTGKVLIDIKSDKKETKSEKNESDEESDTEETAKNEKKE